MAIVTRVLLVAWGLDCQFFLHIVKTGGSFFLLFLITEPAIMADEKRTFSINPGCKSWINSDPASVNSPRSYGVVLEFFVVFVILVKQNMRYQFLIMLITILLFWLNKKISIFLQRSDLR